MNKNVCNSIENWNPDKCQCECKESVDYSSCKKGHMWNPSTDDCECDKTCGIGKYLVIKNLQRACYR